MHLLSASTVTKIASELCLLIKFQKDTINKCIMSSIQAVGAAPSFVEELIYKTDIASGVSLFEGPLRSEHLRTNCYKQHLKLVSPAVHELPVQGRWDIASFLYHYAPI